MELKDMETKLNTLEASIKSFIEKAEAEIKLNGKTSEETKTALEAQMKQATELMNRMLAVEQKLTVKGSDDKLVKSIGELVTESDSYKSMAAGGRTTGPVDVGHLWKTALVNATGQNQPLVQAYRMPGIVVPGQQRLTIRDLFPAVPTTSNMIEYCREASFTNNAAVQGAASSPQVYENVSKTESAATFELLYQPVHTIAHWIPVSRQLLADAPAIAGYINARLLYGLKLKEETELLTGTGVGASIAGLVTRATAYDTTKNVSGDTKIDTIRRAIAQVEAANMPADFVVLNPADWQDIELIKTTGTSSSGEYIFADPHSITGKRIWGRPVVDTASLTAGQFMVGSSMTATIWDRAGATIEVSREHSDYFIKNMAAVLVEERVGLTVHRPDGLIYGAFPA